MNQQPMINVDELTLEEIDKQIHLLNEYKQKLVAQEKTEDTPSQKYECVKNGNRKVVVIGGKGQLGRLFVRLFRDSDYPVETLEKDDWPHASQLLANAALVIVAVPIHLTDSIISQLKGLADDCILADITSIKQKPLSAMLDVHGGPVVGLHPMFGPDVEDFCDQTIVVCHGREEEQYEWLLRQLLIWRVRIHRVTAAEHDQTMAIVQVLRHFSTVAYGVHLAKENGTLSDILAMSSPIYRLELAMVGRLFAQNPDLYTEIIFANQDNVDMMQRFIDRFGELLTLIKLDDKAAFKKAFLQTREWFGEYADRFLTESGQMLAAAHHSIRDSR
ncbi:bifunctional chorismate mutase/prephenate dehydrogenase [Aliikangiella coralliicola]|uniref:Bifunctional chorismate mutase/prephenate dehydrogenase n=1 Tax=Aliikangiella coralliicola TaxID=2592383 RepID=A0A545U517_9GAMM|nr:bifunctional chorismate mutase/prephenate dehydrogenase [Aliikangiella coralliicola]TQV84552.1 bifunctional chorismate mutase/prephenate dehydrogenase [Aliikangiella coralliicola]